MIDASPPHVDVVLLTRDASPLPEAVARAIEQQAGVCLQIHRIVGHQQTNDQCRWETIARARNKGKLCGSAPWLMFLDDDVVLDSCCVATLVRGLKQRPAYAALAADYRGDYHVGQMAQHVAMGATLFRRNVLEKVEFTWQDNKCECQCCCDDLRRMYWGIDYLPDARARHLSHGPTDLAGEINISPGIANGALDCTDQEPALSKNPSVCLVLCYFGPLPGWIDHYLLSCAYNPSVNFLIVTNQAEFPPIPSNVRVKRLTVSEFNLLASRKIGCEINLQHPRKLCDFKPAYGHLFQEELAGWDYWGYTDMDVVYGDIRRFLTAANLSAHDIYSARKEYLVGHFSLFRNTHRLRTLYQQSTDLVQTLRAPEVLSFDECGRQWVRRMRGLPLTDGAACDSMTHIVHRLVAQNEISACFAPDVLEWPELPNSGWRLQWDAGRLYLGRQRHEVMYYHFHGYKLRPGYRRPSPLHGATAFDVSPLGLHFTRLRSCRSKPNHQNAFSPEFRAASLQSIVSIDKQQTEEHREEIAPQVLATFNRQHLRLFQRYFWASFRAMGIHELLIPVAVGLYPSERKRLSSTPGMNPVFRTDSGEHVARSRLREFSEITRKLPPATPIAYWDAGDVIFQSRLDALWELVREHSGKLLAAREPSGYPENPAVVQWTKTIADLRARLEAQRTIFHCPFLNSGFLAGTAGAMTKYFDTVVKWYATRKLGGSGDPGDQLALNVYCHSQPDIWHEISEGWNYCLWGRSKKTFYRRNDGRLVDVRGVPIHVVHGNAQTLEAIPRYRTRFHAIFPAAAK